MVQTMTEEEFITDALHFFRDAVGEDEIELGPDTDLYDAPFFDSLLLVSFLQFIEERRGSPIPMSTDAGIPLEALKSIRTTYQGLISPAATGE